MTLDEVRQTAGVPFDTVRLEGCTELVPEDPSLDFALWSKDGRAVDFISDRGAGILTTSAGIRRGSSVEAVKRAYPGATRKVALSTYFVVRSSQTPGRAMVFEVLTDDVSNMFAGRLEMIEHGGHCP